MGFASIRTVHVVCTADHYSHLMTVSSAPKFHFQNVAVFFTYFLLSAYRNPDSVVSFNSDEQNSSVAKWSVESYQFNVPRR